MYPSEDLQYILGEIGHQQIYLIRHVHIKTQHVN